MNYELYRATRDIVLECAEIARENGYEDGARHLETCIVRTSNRMTRAAGYASWRPREGYKIVISNVLFGNGKNAAELRETVTHEAAHIVAGLKEGHNHRWKRVHRLFGGTAARTHNLDVKIKKRAKKAVKCSICGNVFPIGPTRFKRIVTGKAEYRHKGCRGSVLRPAEAELAK